MPIRRMVEYAELVREGPHTVARRRAMLERHRDALDAQLAEIGETRTLLDRKIAMYEEMENSQ